jgi:alpha,alpha-trehalase
MMVMSSDSTRQRDAECTPLRLYGQLFIDVQMNRVFGDGKTFVDAVPKRLTPQALCALYERERQAPAFSLRDFVHKHFAVPRHETPLGPQSGIREHIHGLWPLLLRRTAAPVGAPVGADTLLPLPYPYVVPGGRFRELYYWDSYFTMLGLRSDGYPAVADDMLSNFASLIDRYGFIPNSSRSYMLSRSQPPFFFKMIESLAPDDPAAAFGRYLPRLRREHGYWMAGEDALEPGTARGHVVCLADGAILNRYWDERDDPREESYREDVLTARAGDRPAEQIYRDLRAGAESGWDFSSRWCADPDRIETIETTSIVPVDLNALLWGLESAIAMGARHQGDAAAAAEFAARVDRRREAINRVLWSADLGHYVDFHWVKGEQRHQLTAAALAPLYVGVANQAQADAMARVASGGLLTRNGLQTTLRRTGQQWDAPNGWAPLQWVGAIGLQRYGHTVLARDIASRWVASVHRVYLETGRLLEKYDVMEDRPGGGGEYETQDGFGWTNGTFVALNDLLLRH